MIPIVIFIIIGVAIGGFVFFSYYAEMTISPYEAWNKWSLENNWNFFGNEDDYKMLLTGQHNNREIQISSVRYESIVDDPRDETELQLILKQTLPEGLRVHPFEGIDKKIKELPHTTIVIGHETIDKKLFIAAHDVHTSKWLLSFGPIKEVLKMILDEHLTSRIEGRSIYLRREGLSTNNFQEMIDKATFMATIIDDHLMLSWKQLIQRFNLDPIMIDSNGLPRVQGTIEDFPIRLSLNQNPEIMLNIRVDLTQSCPKDVEMCGHKSDAVIAYPIDYFEEVQKIARLGMNQNSLKSQQTFQAFRNSALHDKIRSFFARYPYASLTNGRLRLQVTGRNDSMLEFFIKEIL